MSRATPSGPARRKLGLVLAGGAARGAYEAGVVAYLLTEVSKALGYDVPLDVLCGTSVGAINACFLAAHADDSPAARASGLMEHWGTLRVDDIVRFDRAGVSGIFRSLLGRPAPMRKFDDRRGGLLDPIGIERIVGGSIPFARIEANVQSGLVHALTVSTTHVGSGRTVVFVHCRGELPRWGTDPTIVPYKSEITEDHALASAAIPMLFPAVRIRGDFFCDGGLRQNVPLSPARRMGADGLLIVSPRFLPDEPPPFSFPNEVEAERVRAYPGLFFLLGKALNALLLDRVDADLDRLQRINQILAAGEKRYGSGFIHELNLAMGRTADDPIRPLQTVLVRASRDIGRMTAEYVRTPGFSDRVSNVLGYVMRRLAEGDAENEADLLSYLLFDGTFARQLIELGRQDARAQHEELCALVTSLVGQ